MSTLKKRSLVSIDKPHCQPTPQCLLKILHHLLSDIRTNGYFEIFPSLNSGNAADEFSFVFSLGFGVEALVVSSEKGTSFEGEELVDMGVEYTVKCDRLRREKRMGGGKCVMEVEGDVEGVANECVCAGSLEDGKSGEVTSIHVLADTRDAQFSASWSNLEERDPLGFVGCAGVVHCIAVGLT